MSGTSVETNDEVTSPAEALSQRVTQAMMNTLDLVTFYLGDRLGFYRELAAGPLTSRDLASRTETHERFVREWLEQQTVAGILVVDRPDDSATERSYVLPPGHVEALTDRDSPFYVGSLAQATVSILRPLDAVMDSFRSGTGIPFETYGHDGVEGMALTNRGSFLQLFGNQQIPMIADVHARLQTDPPARVADIGCGGGWTSIAIALAYPKVTVDGFEIDPLSVAMARANIDEAGLAERVSIQQHDLRTGAHDGSYDLVIAVNCIHDLSDPVSMLRAMRMLAGANGFVIDVEPGAGEHFTGEVDEKEAFRYAASILHCLPVGLVEQPSVATGMVMRPGTLRAYAQQAGFRDIDLLPIEDPGGLAFYRLQH